MFYLIGYGAAPPSFTVQLYVPVKVVRAAPATAALYLLVPMVKITLERTACAAHDVKSAS